MHLNAHLDVDLVAVEEEDEVTLLLELTAPPAPKAEERAPATLEVVLDRSGSMDGGRFAAALLPSMRWWPASTRARSSFGP